MKRDNFLAAFAAAADAFGRQTAELVRDWTPDAMLLAGAAGVAYGCGLVYRPAGFIAGGLLLIVGGYIASRRPGA